ncbi:MAG TPA: hypothetical protein VMU03_01200 [Gammaproteobacteria bacterium]|nr:hypothetical protein [Gammaproteobacteria bacterium]
MILGVSTATFLQIHVALSLIGIATGLVAVLAMIRGKLVRVSTAVFLATTVLTSATGFPLPPFGLDPARIIGSISLVVLALALAALYVFRLAGAWRWVYVVTATIALYFNCFVAVVQTFQKIELFRALAPTQQEPPFAIAQLVVLALFIAFGVLGVKGFRPVLA